MAVLVREYLVSGAGQCSNAGLVGHGARWDETGRFLAEQLRTPLLKSMDGRVVPKNIVTEFGIHHGCPHLFRRLGDGVASEVDDLVHVPMIDSSVPSGSKFPLCGRSSAQKDKSHLNVQVGLPCVRGITCVWRDMKRDKTCFHPELRWAELDLTSLNDFFRISASSVSQPPKSAISRSSSWAS